MAKTSKIGSVFKKSNGKSKLMFSLVAIVAVAALGFGLSGGSKNKEIGSSRSDTGAVAISNSDPLGDKVDKEYYDLAKKSNKERIKVASDNGKSAIPTLIDMKDIIVTPEPEKKDVQPQQETTIISSTESVEKKNVPKEMSMEPMYQAIYDEQKQIIENSLDNLNSTFPKELHSIVVFSSGNSALPLKGTQDTGGSNNIEGSTSNGRDASNQSADVNSSDPSTSISNERPKIPVGTIISAVTLTEANSDEPGPIRAKVIGGELDGAILIGNFSVNKESMTMNYNAITKDGNVATINTFAVDPDTTRTALATNVDHHYFYRYGMFLSSTFINGFATAISSAGSTTTQTTAGPVQTTNPVINTNQQLWAGGAELGKEFASIAKENYKTPNTITVSSGQLIGILFTDSADASWLPQLKAEGL